MKSLGLCYLATPYTRFDGGHESAFIEACQISARLMKMGVNLFCPIAMSHPIIIHGGINAIDHDFWMEFNTPMLEVANTLVVAQMDGWDVSRGIECEIDFFKIAGKPILYLDTETLSLGQAPSPLSKSQS